MTHQDYVLRLFKYFAQFIPKTVLEDSLKQPEHSCEDGYAEVKAELLLPSERIINEFTNYICSSNEAFVADKTRNSEGFILFVEYGTFRTNPSGEYGVGKKIAITVAHPFTHTNHDNLNESLLLNRCNNLLNHILITLEYDQQYNNGCGFIGKTSFPADASPLDPESFFGRVGWTAFLSVDETMMYDPLNTPWPDPGGHTPASVIEQRLSDIEETLPEVLQTATQALEDAATAQGTADGAAQGVINILDATSEHADVKITNLKDTTSGGEVADSIWTWLGVAEADKKKVLKVLVAILTKIYASLIFYTPRTAQTITTGAILLDRDYTFYNSYTMSGALALSVEAGAAVGGTAEGVIVGDGTNTPTLSGITKWTTSSDFDATAAKQNHWMLIKLNSGVYIFWTQLN